MWQCVQPVWKWGSFYLLFLTVCDLGFLSSCTGVWNVWRKRAVERWSWTTGDQNSFLANQGTKIFGHEHDILTQVMESFHNSQNLSIYTIRHMEKAIGNKGRFFYPGRDNLPLLNSMGWLYQWLVVRKRKCRKWYVMKILFPKLLHKIVDSFHCLCVGLS